MPIRILKVTAKDNAPEPDGGWSVALVPTYLDKDRTTWRLERTDAGGKEQIGKVILFNDEQNPLPHFSHEAARALNLDLGQYNFELT